MFTPLRLESPETTGEEFLFAPERQLQEITDGLIAYCNAERLTLARFYTRGRDDQPSGTHRAG